MSLSPGTRIGPYEITGALGAGGMGEVYRARDTKLGRDVAVKVLPASFAHDPDRLARFEREAQVLASLNHPNIATIHGFEEGPGGRALIMELVEGPTLADQLAEGSIAVNDALPIARQIVDALDIAHSQGIVHRDLKPANIKVRPDGTVKILDFGLAKIASTETTERTEGTENSPTLTARATQMGVIIGTAAYMAPEQARGKAVDKRVDIWAFGCVLYEMVTGKRLFVGEDLTETLASVVKENPSLEAAPPGLQRLLKRCLEKDPKRRLRDIADAWDLLEIAPAAVGTMRPARRPWLAWSIAALATVASIGALAYIGLNRPGAPTRDITRFHVAWPIEPGARSIGGAHFFQLSPNGKYLAIVSEGVLWVRALAEVEPVRLDRTEGATYPFWSPDSEQIGFFQGDQMKVVARAGGSPRFLSEAPNARGGTWGGNTIVFSSSGNPAGALWQVSEQGGSPRPATTRKETGPSTTGHRYPQFLPDGRRFLFLVVASQADTTGVYVGSLDGMAPVRVIDGVFNAMFAGSDNRGFLIFLRGDTLMAQPFDAGTLKTSGTPIPVTTGVGLGENTGLGAYSVAPNGTVAIASGVNFEYDLAWVNRAGARGDTVATKSAVNTFALSPDQKRVAIGQLGNGRDSLLDIWLQTIGASASRFTFGPMPGWIFPQWSPAGDEIAFTNVDTAGQASYEIRKKRADMAGVEETLFATSGATLHLWDWSKDGKYLVYSALNDLFQLPLSGDRKPIQLTKTPEYHEYAQISPNGRWMAYAAGPRGASHVLVQPMPPTGAFWQVSPELGDMPRWRADGKELYYRAGDGNLMAVPVTDTAPGGAFTFSTTHQKLFPVTTYGNVARYTYQPAPDGSRFLVSISSAGVSQPITLILNWQTQK